LLETSHILGALSIHAILRIVTHSHILAAWSIVIKVVGTSGSELIVDIALVTWGVAIAIVIGWRDYSLRLVSLIEDLLLLSELLLAELLLRILAAPLLVLPWNASDRVH
jgi:hypothetical protein